MKLPTPIARRLIAVGLSLGLAAVALAAPPPAATPNKTEANITRLTTGLLEHSQFAHHPLDSELAGKFLDGYLDALDGRRSLFLQTDVQEFAPFRVTLAQATRDGDTTVAHAIWRRYQQRRTGDAPEEYFGVCFGET